MPHQSAKRLVSAAGEITLQAADESCSTYSGAVEKFKQFE